MATWDIDPQGVAGVLARTKNHADHFEVQLATIGTAMTEGAKNGSSQLVANAIAGWAESRSPTIKRTMYRVGSMMRASVEATNAYLDGDLEMAATAQRAATAAPPADLPSGPGRSRAV